MDATMVVIKLRPEERPKVKFYGFGPNVWLSSFNSSAQCRSAAS